MKSRPNAALIGVIAFLLPLACKADAQRIDVLPLVTNHIIYEPVSGKIYALVPSAAGAGGNSLQTIDPSSGKVTTKGYIGSEPDTLAASGDGAYIYVGLDGSNSVSRFNVAANASDLSFYVGEDSSFGVLHAG